MEKAEGVYKQSQKQESEWWWLRNETPELNDIVTEASGLRDQSQDWMFTGTLKTLKAQKGAETEPFLRSHKGKVEKAITKLKKPLNCIVQSHEARLKVKAKEEVEIKDEEDV